MVKIVKARLILYNNERGRRTPFVAGYRPLFSFNESHNDNTSGQILLIDRDKFYPGNEAIVEIHFLKERVSNINLAVNVKFWFREGRGILGEGQILEVIN